MLDSAINRVVRLTVTTSSWELERVLAWMTHDARLNIRRDLEKDREAHGFEADRHCAYYLRRQGLRVVVWRWSHVASDAEATRLRLPWYEDEIVCAFRRLDQTKLCWALLERLL